MADRCLPRPEPGPAVGAFRYGVIAAFLFSAWAVCFHLGDFPLLSPDEGRNAEVAREMKVAGTWLVPTYNGAIYLDKPAFFFKAVALSLAAFGDTEAAARLPSALSACGLLALLFFFCRRVYDITTAALAMVIVAATPLFMAFARIVIFDMMLALCVSVAILAAYLAEEQEGPRRRHWYLAATLAAGLATLVKGPVGFLVPLLVMTVFHLVTGRRDAIQRFFAPAHIGLFLLVVLPWFVGLSLACPDFPYYGIMQESIARFTTPAFRRTQPFYYYALIIAGCFFAWSMLLPGALRLAFRAHTRLCRADQLFMVWALVVILFFSLSQSKLPGYILTGVVALGVLTARVFAAALSGRNDAALAMVRRSCVGLALASGLLAAPIVALIIAPLASPKPRWLTAEGLAWFGPLLPGLVITLGSVAALALLAAAARRAQLALLAFLSFPVLLLTLNFELIPRHASQKSARGLFEQLPAGLPANTEFACLGCLPHGLPFYLGRLVTVFSEDGGELTSNYVLFALGSGQPWPERLVPFTDLDRYLASRAGPVFLLARGPRRATVASLAPAGAAILTFNNDYVGTLLPARAP